MESEWKTYVDRVCLYCGDPFKAILAETKRGRGKYCSASCRSIVAGKSSSGQFGKKENHPNWKGGIANTGDRKKAGDAVYYATHTGKLTRQPCMACGDTEFTEAHHFDYSKKLEVIWLCKTCHEVFKMEKLKRLIGLAPSELSQEDLLQKIKARQELVAGVLQEFRERMSGARGKPEAQGKASVEAVELKDLMAQMKEAGLTMEDLKRIARGGKE